MENDFLNKQKQLLIFTAKSLHIAEKDENAFSIMKNAIDMDSKLDSKVRNLFFDIVLGIINPRRTILAQLSEKIEKETKEKNHETAKQLKIISDNTYNELERICQELLSIINQQLIPGNEDPESTVDFMRLQADLCRYSFAFAPEEKKDFYKIRCESIYSEAFQISSNKLPIHSLSRLSLDLNYSIFLAECISKKGNAISIAESEAQKLLSSNSEISETSFHKAMIFSRKLRDKIVQWKE